MTSPTYLTIHGEFSIVGFEPDGDSVRFVPDKPALLSQLQQAGRLEKASPKDGSFQLRFEAIDAPELHYGIEAQPLGAEARDALLKLMGFGKVTFAGVHNTLVTAAGKSVRGAILSQMIEAHGRPVAWVLLDDGSLPRDGRSAQMTAQLLEKTMNARMLHNGMAYSLVYTSLPTPLLTQVEKLAAAARKQQLGVWKEDSTARWKLDTQADIAPGGQLIFPKLFRRCTDYLKAVAGGFRGELVDWLVTPPGHSRSEDDRARVHGINLKLDALLEQQNDRIAFQPDLLDVVFVEH